MTCNCIADMDAVLAPHNGRIAGTIVFPRTDAINLGQPYDTVTIGVEKIASRGKRPPLAAPTFCPFCGERYVAPALGTAAAQAAETAGLDPKGNGPTPQGERSASPLATPLPSEPKPAEPGDGR